MTGIVRIFLMALLLAAAWGHAAPSCPAAESAPFALPTSARVSEGSADGRGWAASGVIGVSFEQAQAQLSSKVAAAGWTHIHTIALGKDRVLDAWSRGAEELTVMTWRVAPGKSGFSYGVSRKARGEQK